MKIEDVFSGQTIGLFLKSKHVKWIDLISNELKSGGAEVVLIQDEEKILDLIWDDKTRPNAIVFDADLVKDSILEKVGDFKINLVSVLIRSNELASISIENGKQTTLSFFIQSIISTNKYKIKDLEEKVK